MGEMLVVEDVSVGEISMSFLFTSETIIGRNDVVSGIVV